MSRNVDRLVGRGWLRTEPGDDERSHVLVVTAKGKRLLEKAHGRLGESPETDRRHCGRSGRQSHSRIVRKITLCERKLLLGNFFGPLVVYTIVNFFMEGT